MKRAVILLVLVSAVVAPNWGQTPARDLEASAAVAGGGSSSMPVNVVNLPTDETATAVATAPTLVSHRLHELLEVDIDLPMSGIWLSEPFDTANFTHYIVKSEGLISSGYWSCHLIWQLTGTGTFDVPHYLSTTSIQYSRTTPGNVNKPSPKSEMNGVRGRVECSPSSASVPGTITEINVFLTRE